MYIAHVNELVESNSQAACLFSIFPPPQPHQAIHSIQPLMIAYIPAPPHIYQLLSKLLTSKCTMDDLPYR